MEAPGFMTRVIVVGGGNAALCAAIGAREQGAEVLVLERAPFELRGGNSRFTAGGMRFAYRGSEEIRTLVPELSPEELARTDFGSYSRESFYDDMGAHHELPHGPGTGRQADRREFRHPALDGRPRRPVPAPCTAGSPSTPTGGSASGAGSPSRPGAGGPGSWTACRASPGAWASKHGTERASKPWR